MTELARVFIGSSSDSLHLAQALEGNLEERAEVRVWNQDLFQTGNSALEDLLQLTQDFDFAIFVWPSQQHRRGLDNLQASDKVVLETGVFYGVLGKERVFIVLPDEREDQIPDLAGITHLFFRQPSDRNYRTALEPAAARIAHRIADLGPRTRPGALERSPRAPEILENVHSAWQMLKQDCYDAVSIAIYGIRGLSAFGTDQSLISLAELDRYRQLKKVRIILLGEDSRWINSAFVKLRTYESVEVFKKSLRAGHEIIETTMARLSERLRSSKSGVRYHLGEPKFGLVVTDKVAYITSYAESPTQQVVDLPMVRFERRSGSLYAAFKRYFDDLWHNDSIAGKYLRKHIDFETSAGGIIIAESEGKKYVALLRRHDGYWVLPKGHRLHTDERITETALREVVEETGLHRDDLIMDRPAGYYTYDEKAESVSVTKVVHLFIIRCPRGILPPLDPVEFAEARWWDMQEPLQLLLYTYQRSYLHEVIEAELGPPNDTGVDEGAGTRSDP